MRTLTEDDVAQRRALAELEREDRAARDAMKAAARAARADEKRRQRAQEAEDRRLARVARAERRAEQAASLAALGRRLRPVAPLLLVTGFAMYAQYAYGFDNYSSPTTPWLLRVLIALGAAVAVESIANYVQWHAHDALLLGATSTAARLRRASYVIAFGVAAVNYSHFSNGWDPTPAAVVFALFSASQPWLWGLHTRRAQRIQLIREGHVDSSGATFSAERWRAFPWLTFQARRWSIDHGVDDPRAAWAGYKAERVAARAEQQAKKAARKAAKRATQANAREDKVLLDRPEPPAPAESTGASETPDRALNGAGDERANAGEVVDRTAQVDVERDGAVIDDLRALAAKYGRRYAREDLKVMYRMGSPRADRLLNLLGWAPRAKRADDQAGAGDEQAKVVAR